MIASNSFEGGTSGTQVTTANSGGASGNAFDVATQGAGGTLQYDSTEAAHGSLSCKIQATTASAVFLQWTTNTFSSAITYFRLYAFFTGNPGATSRLYNITDGTSVMSVFLNSAGKLVVSYGSVGTTFVTFTNSIPTGTWFRVEGFCIESPTVGQVSTSLFPGDSTSATESHTSAATLNTGTFSAPTSDFGDSSGVGTIGPYWIDDIALSSTGPLGPVLTAGTAALTVAPVFAAAAVRTVIPGAALTVTPVFRAVAVNIPAGGGGTAPPAVSDDDPARRIRRRWLREF
jgi:hypothetical protein